MLRVFAVPTLFVRPSMRYECIRIPTFHVSKLCKLAHVRAQHFGLNDSAGSHDHCDGWPLPPNPIRLCMYEVDKAPEGLALRHRALFCIASLMPDICSPFPTGELAWFVPVDRTDTAVWIMQNRGNNDV